LSNLKFALAVEPENPALQTYSVLCKDKRAHGLPTLPSSIDIELQINPFLRSRQPQVIATIKNIDSSATTEAGVFAALRQWKNDFR
jgi:hydroxyacylglutathione hydrolase